MRVARSTAMFKVKFKRTVLRATSALVQQGYQLSEPQPASDIVRFCKRPAAGVSCCIDFQLLHHFIPPARRFNVLLSRMRLPELSKEESRYLPLAIDLPNLMWFVHGLQAVPVGRCWEFTDEQSLLDQLTHAQSLLIDYAIGWLEDPLTSDPWQIPAVEREAFRNILTTVVAKELKPQGYELRNMAVVDLPLFVKRLHDDLNGIIEFKQARLLNPPRLAINVELHRKVGDNPYEDQVPRYRGWLSTRLDTLLWLGFGVDPIESVDWRTSYREEGDKSTLNKVSSPPVLPWQYTEYAELQRLMENLLDKIKLYAIPWLEDPTSRNP